MSCDANNLSGFHSGMHSNNSVMLLVVKVANATKAWYGQKAD